MLTEQGLFQGTVYHPALHHAIFTDIQNLRNRFPTLNPNRYHYQAGDFVFIQGPICIKIQNYDAALPLSIVIPQDFPNSPPYVSIPIQQGIQLIPSQALQQNGVINTNVLYPWVPRQTTIAQLVEEIGRYFDYYPPYSVYQIQMFGQPPPYVPRSSQSQHHHQQQQQPQKPQLNMEERKEIALAIADSLIEQNNNKINEAYQRKLELALTKNLSEILSSLKVSLSNEEQQAKQSKNALNNSPLPQVQVNPTIEQNARDKAQQKSYAETSNAIKASLHEGKIGTDQFIKITRDLSRNYFEIHLLPSFQ